MTRRHIYFLFLIIIMVSCKKKNQDQIIPKENSYGDHLVKDVDGGWVIIKSITMMDTIFTISCGIKAGPNNNQLNIKNQINKMENAFREIGRIHNLMSSHNNEGDVYKINSGVGKIKVSFDTWKVLSVASIISNKSQGAFDVTWAILRPLYKIKKAGWKPPDDHVLADILKNGGFNKLKLTKEGNDYFVEKPSKLKIDLGGIAKGYSLGTAGEMLKGSHLSGYIINGGGDLLVFGQRPDRPWTVGVRHPRSKSGKLYLKGHINNAAIVTSGDYERYVIIDGKRFSHILDPRTGKPAGGCISTTVIGKDPTVADALATALMVTGLEDGKKLMAEYPDYAWLVFTSDEKEYRSTNFLNTFNIIAN